MADRRTTLCFVGDTMLGRGVSTTLLHKKPDEILGELKPILTGCDGVVTNLECPITRNDKSGRRTLKAFRMRAAPHAVHFLTAANVKFVNLANNHILDFGAEGLSETLTLLDANRIAHGGAGMDECSARSPVVANLGHLSLGFISLTDRMGKFAAVDGACGTNFVSFDGGASDLKRQIGRAVEKLRSMNADLIVLSGHFGPDLRQAPIDEYRDLAHGAIDLGVDVIHGHSCHVYQGIELYKNKPIFYDTGNFYDDYYVIPYFRNNESFIYMISVVDGAVTATELVPFFRHGDQLHLAEGKAFGRMTERMIRKSDKFGTSFDCDGNRLIVRQ